MPLPAGVTQITFWRAGHAGYVDHDTPIAATFVREETRDWPGSAGTTKGNVETSRRRISR